MSNYQKLNEIAGIKTRLSRLKFQSDILKNNFFDYIEGLNSEYNVLTNYSRDDFRFDIYGNKLKLQATYNNEETSSQGKLSVLIIKLEDKKEIYNELFFWKFDSYGNIKSIDYKQDFSCNDFSEYFYIELMNKLIDSNQFEL